jgi:hypothetical protein
MTKAIDLPSKEFLLSLFDYKDGDLYRKPEKSGTVDGGGYIQTGIKGRYYKNHRLIFMMHHGYCPEYIDHVNGNKLDNRIENLRAATHSENLYNRKLQSNNLSGVKGVSWDKSSKKWKARISVDGKDLLLGKFDSIEEARDTVNEARKKHGEFANYGGNIETNK